ncbi:unnamed protein product, partial [marine sediment metagenome]
CLGKKVTESCIKGEFLGRRDVSGEMRLGHKFRLG